MEVEFNGQVYQIPLSVEAQGSVAIEKYCEENIPGYAEWRKGVLNKLGEEPKEI
jgi:hypothetical protein